MHAYKPLRAKHQAQVIELKKDFHQLSLKDAQAKFLPWHSKEA